jgi:alpha-tubulin suppressor-like RCC1 family protein
VNPCKLPVDADGVSLFHPLFMARYRSRVAGYVLEGLPANKQKLLTLEPHVFDVAETASRALRTNSTNQAIIFMGESGSGKTEAYKNMLQYSLLRKPLEAHGCIPSGAVLTVTTGGASVSKGAIAAGFDVPFAPLLLEASFSSLSKRILPSTAAAAAPTSSLSPAARGLTVVEKPSVFAQQLQRNHPLVDVARKDSDRRKGPLGSARNPWFAFPNVGGESRDVSTVTSSVTGGRLSDTDFFKDDGITFAQRQTLSKNADPLKQIASAAPRFGRALLAAHTVLDAFGTAAMQGNASSSRFIRSTKLFYDASTDSLCGGEINAVLLEPRRVLGASFDPRAYSTAQNSAPRGGAVGYGAGSSIGVNGPIGRNFNIFYQLLSGSSRALSASLLLGSPTDYLCLYQSSQGAAVGVGLGSGSAVGVTPSNSSFYSALSSTESSSSHPPLSSAFAPSTVSSTFSTSLSASSSSSSYSPSSNGAQYIHGVPLPVRALAVPAGGSSLSFKSSGGGGCLFLSAFSTVLADGEELANTQRAMLEMGIEHTEQIEIFRILSAILMSGNVRFVDSVDDPTTTSSFGGQGAPGSPSQLAGGSAGYLSASVRETELLADLLGVDRQALSEVLTKRTRGGPLGSLQSSSSPSKDNDLKKPVTWTFRRSADARASLDGVITSLYSRLFAWIVARANASALEAAGGPAAMTAAMRSVELPSGQREPLHIVLLDSPGLEGALSMAVENAMFHSSSSDNEKSQNAYSYLSDMSHSLPAIEVGALRSLDSLVINYVSERVHELFLTSVFRNERDLCEAEGVSSRHVEFDDNNGVCSLLDDPQIGLLRNLDEASAISRSTDESLMSNATSLHRRSNAWIRPLVVNDNLPASPGPSVSLLVSNPTPKAGSTFSAPISGAAAGYDSNLFFGIRHTGGSVLYTAGGFVSVNRSTADRVDGDILALLQTTSSPFLKDLVAGSSTGRTSSASTLSDMPIYKSKIVELTEMALRDISPSTQLSAGTVVTTPYSASRLAEDAVGVLGPLRTPQLSPHFVLCLRPNTRLQPSFVEPELLHTQLVEANVLQALSLHHTGYAYKAKFIDFYKRFVLLHQTPRGGNAGGRALTFPPPPSADLRELCRELFNHILSHPVFAGTAIDARKEVIFGRSRVMVSRTLLETLETLRNVRLDTMERHATRIQAFARGWKCRQKSSKLWAAVRRIQASIRATEQQQKWLAIRRSIRVLQSSFRASRATKKFSRFKTSVVKLQNWVRCMLAIKRYQRVKQGLNRLLCLSHGYIARAQTAKMLKSVHCIQAFARMVIGLARYREVKHAAASALQAAWRGYAFRIDHEEVLAFLAVRRAKRSTDLAAARIQSFWRGARVHRKFSKIVNAATKVQRWFATKLAGARLIEARSSIVKIQSIVRCFLAKCKVARIRMLRQLADSLWRLHASRTKEHREVSLFCAADLLTPMPQAVRLILAAAAGVPAPLIPGSGLSQTLTAKKSQAKETSSSGFAPPPVLGASATNNNSSSGGLQNIPYSTLPANSPLLSSVSAGFSGGQSAALMHVYQGTLLLDVDAVSENVALAHPNTISRSVAQLEHDLRVAGTRIANLAIGATHAVVLSETGQLYSWGFGDRGQCGHGRTQGEGKPKVIESLLIDRGDGLPGSTESLLNTDKESTKATFRNSSSLSLPLRIKSVVCGDEHTVALTEGGRIFSFGSNKRGQLGLGSISHAATPSLVNIPIASSAGDDQLLSQSGGTLSDATRVVEIAAGGFHTVALTSSGLVYTWGDGLCLGRGPFRGSGDSNVPVNVSSIARIRVRHISSGPDFVVVVASSGDVYSWGSGTDGCLGLGEDVYRRTTTIPSTSSPSRTVQSTYEFAGRLRPRFVPSLIEGFAVFERHSRIVQVVCGGRHCIAVSSTGRVFTWGSNSHGQLGLGAVGPLTSSVLAQHDAKAPSLPLHYTPESTIAGAARASFAKKEEPTARPYSAVPIWVSSLEQHHVVSVVAGSRSSGAVTDLRCAFSWGCSAAPWAPVDLSALLIRGAAALHSDLLSGSSGKRGGNNSIQSIMSEIATHPLFFSETERGAPALCVLPSPTELLLGAGGTSSSASGLGGTVSMSILGQSTQPSSAAVAGLSLPGRTFRKLIIAYNSNCASVCLAQYSQLPIGDTVLRDAAVARAVIAGSVQNLKESTSSRHITQLPHATPLLPASILSSPSLVNVLYPGGVQTAATYPFLLASALSVVEPSAADDAEVESKQSARDGMKGHVRVSGLLAAVTGSATSSSPTKSRDGFLSPLGGRTSTAADALRASERKKVLQGALLRGVAGIEAQPFSSAATPAANGKSSSTSSRRALSEKRIGGGGQSLSSDDVNPRSSARATNRTHSPIRSPGSTASTALALYSSTSAPSTISSAQLAPLRLPPSIVRIVHALSRVPQACAAISGGLTSDKIRALDSYQISVLVEKVIELCGGGAEGLAAARAAAIAAPSNGHASAFEDFSMSSKHIMNASSNAIKRLQTSAAKSRSPAFSDRMDFGDDSLEPSSSSSTVKSGKMTQSTALLQTQTSVSASKGGAGAIPVQATPPYAKYAITPASTSKKNSSTSSSRKIDLMALIESNTASASTASVSMSSAKPPASSSSTQVTMKALPSTAIVTTPSVSSGSNRPPTPTRPMSVSDPSFNSQSFPSSSSSSSSSTNTGVTLGALYALQRASGAVNPPPFEQPLREAQNPSLPSTASSSSSSSSSASNADVLVTSSAADRVVAEQSTDTLPQLSISERLKQTLEAAQNNTLLFGGAAVDAYTQSVHSDNTPSSTPGATGGSKAPEDEEEISDRVVSLQKQLEAVRMRSSVGAALHVPASPVFSTFMPSSSAAPSRRTAPADMPLIPATPMLSQNVSSIFSSGGGLPSPPTASKWLGDLVSPVPPTPRPHASAFTSPLPRPGAIPGGDIDARSMLAKLQRELQDIAINDVI